MVVVVVVAVVVAVAVVVVVVVVVEEEEEDMSVTLFTAFPLYCSAEESGHVEDISVRWWRWWWRRRWWWWWRRRCRPSCSPLFLCTAALRCLVMVRT